MENKLNRFITMEQGTKHIHYINVFDIRGENVSYDLMRVEDVGVTEQEDWYGYVYLTIIPDSKKAYIGKHKGKADLNYNGSGRILKKAVEKYGKDNVYTFIVEPVECKNKSEKELASELHELESQWIKHKLGVDIESSSISEFYNLKTAFTKVNMEKQVEDYETMLNNIGDDSFIKWYKKMNLMFTKKEIMTAIIDYNNLNNIFKDISGFDILEDMSTDDKLTILGEYNTKLPCLYDTMYSTFITEIGLLPIEEKIEFIDEDRYEPFNKYISKYLMYSNTAKSELIDDMFHSIPEQNDRQSDKKNAYLLNQLLSFKNSNLNKFVK